METDILIRVWHDVDVVRKIETKLDVSLMRTYTADVLFESMHMLDCLELKFGKLSVWLGLHLPLQLRMNDSEWSEPLPDYMYAECLPDTKTALEVQYWYGDDLLGVGLCNLEDVARVLHTACEQGYLDINETF